MTRNSLFTCLSGLYLLQCGKSYHFLTHHVPIFVLRFSILLLNRLLNGHASIEKKKFVSILSNICCKVSILFSCFLCSLRFGFGRVDNFFYVEENLIKIRRAAGNIFWCSLKAQSEFRANYEYELAMVRQLV